MGGDRWLEPWLPLIRARSAGAPLLELGCGTGRDTATLAGAARRVLAIDRSLVCLAAAKLRAPGAEFHRQDILDLFPVAGAGVVVASLSLHYFPWPETVSLVGRIHRTLLPRGILLCRLNSTADRHFGARGHERIAENFYRVSGKLKRFFDREAVDALFANGWRTLGVQEAVISRYLLPKTVWEVVLERDEPDRG
jgi:SAM-dependent methyltransferase